MQEMADARAPGQVQFFQLYCNSSKEVTANLVTKAESLGYKALCITVDAPGLGRREKDMRHKFAAAPPSAHGGMKDVGAGTGKALSTFIDPSLSWKDITWIQGLTSMPVVLKGIQCGEDAILAAKQGVQGIILSNHGGRQLEFARSAIEVLPEVMDALRSIGAEKRVEVYIDGGIRRGTDIYKALALGAKAVGIGRPAIFGLAAYGQKGVEKAVECFKEEFEMTMRLMGTPKIADIRSSMVCTRNLHDHFAPQAPSDLARRVYQPLQTSVALSRL